ncbi:MAG TPA: TolC family protein, partial [Bacteroidales bacterium]|nr:TolC family protein [Bacteroidales bacterium]
RKIIMVLMILMSVWNVYAQDQIKTLLASIEKNNISLKSLKEDREAARLAASVNLLPDNPEVEYNYLTGSPSTLGNRHDFSIRQTFDFPTAYLFKNKLSSSGKIVSDLNYEKSRQDILLEARKLCVDVIYQENLLRIASQREEDANRMVMAYRKMLEEGKGNKLDLNRALIALAQGKREILLLKNHQMEMLSKLKVMNGGESLVVNMINFPEVPLPANFEDWYSINSNQITELKLLREMIVSKDLTVKVQRSLTLPKFSAGYMSEKVTGEQFQGVTLGMSLPLWGNRNTVKTLKAEYSSLELKLSEEELRIKAEMNIQFDRVISFRSMAENLRTTLLETNNETLLKRALELGEITLMDYLIEYDRYYGLQKEWISNLYQAELTYSDLIKAQL